MDDQVLDQFDDIDSGNDSAPESGRDSSAPPSGQSGEASNSDKRIRDLMSQKQREEARANRLEAELKALKGDGDADGDKAPARPAKRNEEAEQWAALLRDEARKQLFSSDPRLAQYGLSADEITGATPEEMRASLAAKVKFVDSMETAIRNRVLQEHGLDPEVGGGAGEPPVDYASMSSEEFEKHLQRAMNRR